MKPRNQVSKAAIELIKSFEGYRNTAARLPDGRWVIGYGHTLSTREGAEVSQPDAEALLIYDLIAVADAVNTLTFTPLSQNQFDALCAFVYNIGVEPFRGSDVLRHINEGRLLQAACAMELWRRAEFQGNSLIIDAIVRRRAAEKTLFLTPTKGWVPAPSALLRPTVDLDTLGQVPRTTPTVLTTSLDGQDPVIEQAPPPSSPPPTSAQQELPLSLGPAPSPASNPTPAESVASGSMTSERSSDGVEKVIAPSASAPEARETFGLRRDPLPEPSTSTSWNIVDRPKVNLEPILTVGGPALALAIGGIYWSGHGTLGTGLFHPLVIGWLVCLIGLAGLSYAAYLLLVDLGYIEPLHEGQD